jgi:hypothetical protein
MVSSQVDVNALALAAQEVSVKKPILPKFADDSGHGDVTFPGTEAVCIAVQVMRIRVNEHVGRNFGHAQLRQALSTPYETRLVPKIAQVIADGRHRAITGLRAALQRKHEGRFTGAEERAHPVNREVTGSPTNNDKIALELLNTKPEI